jgi:DNA-binding CsgD family transcriptional regulator
LLVWALTHLFGVPRDAAIGLLLVGIASAGPLGIIASRIAGGDTRAALSFIVMTIVGEGPQLWSLLDSLPARAEVADYVSQLLHTAQRVVPPPRPVAWQGLVEPLSEREFTVLRHLASRLDSAEIAAVLYLSVNTVRTHVKAIYRKLGVNSRTDAVSRAPALDLF